MMDQHDLDERIQTAARHIRVPKVPMRRQDGARRWSAWAAVLSVALIAAGLVLGQRLADWRAGTVAASPDMPAPPTVTPAHSTAPTSANGPSLPPQLPVTYENSVLGYRIQLPAGFRRSECLSPDTFTLLSVEQERAQDLGHVARGGVVAMWTFQVAVWPADGMSPTELAERRGCPQCERIASPLPTATDPLTGRAPPSEHVEPAVLDGREAARLLVDGEARLYAVRAADRLYVIELYFDPNVVASNGLTRPAALPAGIVDQVAATFRVLQAGPIPTLTPEPTTPTAATRQVATQLARGLEAGDIAALGPIAPPCWLFTAQSNAGPIGRAVGPYFAELEQRFTRGLRIKADPTVRTTARGQDDGSGGRRLFLSSQWTEGGVTTRADLFLDEDAGRWYWASIRTYPP